MQHSTHFYPQWLKSFFLAQPGSKISAARACWNWLHVEVPIMPCSSASPRFLGNAVGWHMSTHSHSHQFTVAFPQWNKCKTVVSVINPASATFTSIKFINTLELRYRYCCLDWMPWQPVRPITASTSLQYGGKIVAQHQVPRTNHNRFLAHWKKYATAETTSKILSVW